MESRLGYVLGAYSQPHLVEKVRAGKHPRVDYLEYLERESADLLSYDLLEGQTSVLARFFAHRRKHLHWALAVEALRRRTAHSGFLVSAEDVGLPLAILSRLRRSTTPIHLITHGSYFGSPKFARIVRFIRNVPLRYLCLGDTLVDILREDFGVPEGRAVGTGYYADTRFFYPVRAPEDPPVVVAAGTATRDYRTLVDAAKPLGVRLRIAGGSTWFATPLDIEGDSLPENVELGTFDYPELRDLFSASRFVVVPLYAANHACGYSVIAQALACGRPVITTKVRSHSDFIEHGVNGFYVEPGDVGGMRASMERLLDDPALCRSMGEAARARMEESGSVEAYCMRIERAVAMGGGY